MMSKPGFLIVQGIEVFHFKLMFWRANHGGLWQVIFQKIALVVALNYQHHAKSVHTNLTKAMNAFGAKVLALTTTGGLLPLSWVENEMAYC